MGIYSIRLYNLTKEKTNLCYVAGIANYSRVQLAESCFYNAGFLISCNLSLSFLQKSLKCGSESSGAFPSLGHVQSWRVNIYIFRVGASIFTRGTFMSRIQNQVAHMLMSVFYELHSDYANHLTGVAWGEVCETGFVNSVFKHKHKMEKENPIIIPV